MGQYQGNPVLAILTNFQVEYFNQTYRIDVSWIGKEIYIYIYAVRFIEYVDKGHNEVQWGNIGEFQLLLF